MRKRNLNPTPALLREDAPGPYGSGSWTCVAAGGDDRSPVVLPLGRKKRLKALFFGCLLLVLIVAWLGFGERGFIHLYRMERERQACAERILDLEMENRKMLGEIERLRTDEEYIEYVAQKDLGLVRENEVIYRFAREGEDIEPPARPESR